MDIDKKFKKIKERKNKWIIKQHDEERRENINTVAIICLTFLPLNPSFFTDVSVIVAVNVAVKSEQMVIPTVIHKTAKILPAADFGALSP